MTESPEFRIAPDAASLARLAADTFVETMEAALGRGTDFTVAFSGGNTPRTLFGTLASAPYRARVDWLKLQVFFSDERFVPPDSPESNYHLAHETLFSRVPIPEMSIHPVPTVGIAPEAAAEQYESEVVRAVCAGKSGVPRFDLLLLGLGPDGHTASLFPGTAALRVRDRLVAPNYVPKLAAWRITFTYSLINAAATVAFLAEGEGKAECVEQVLRHQGDLPASAVHPTDGRLIWLVDEAAVARHRE